MARAQAILALAMLTAFPASASLIEDQLAPVQETVGPIIAPEGLYYQEDGGKLGDAPDACPDVEADRGVALNAPATDGLLMDVDDESDVYGFALDESTVGTRVAINILTGLLVERYDLAFDVLSPDCGSSVFDAESDYYEQPPADPYQPGLGQAAFNGGLTGYSCDPMGWKMLANQMGGIPAPADIYVEWTNGDFEYVPVSKETPATVAMYRTSSNLDVTVARIVIVLPATWHGQFKIASGPCDAVPGVPEEPPAVTPTYGEFTVQEAGPHIVRVFIARGTVDKTVDTIEQTVADPPTSIPANCHRDLCSVALQFANYDVGAGSAN